MGGCEAAPRIDRRVAFKTPVVRPAHGSGRSGASPATTYSVFTAGTKGAQGPMSVERSSPKAKPGGRSGEAWPSFRSVPCADDCRCYASAPRALPYRSISRARNPITEMLSPSTVQQGTEVRQRPLGYSDIRMTLAIYTHATDGMQDAATEALEEAFS